MIRWCGSCLHFIETCEPYDDFHIVEGVCPPCAARVGTKPGKDPGELQRVEAFFNAIQMQARSGAPMDTSRLWVESGRLGITPLDLMYGILQPLLYEIGSLWSLDLIPVATEQHFTVVVQELLTLIRNARNPGAPPAALQLLLANVEGNRHTMGLEMAELLLAPFGTTFLTVLRGLPVQDLVALVQRERPEALGFSLALPNQLQYVLAVCDALKALQEPPRHLLVGGAALAMGLDLGAYPELRPCQQITDVPAILDGPP